MPLTEAEKQELKQAKVPQKSSKDSIMESMATTTQEMVTITTLKEALADYILLDDIYEYEDNANGLVYFLGMLEMSLIKRKQLLDEDRKALELRKEGR